MKKILFFINTLSGGGAERVLVNLLNMLDSNKYEVYLTTVIGGVHENKLSDKIHFRKIIGNKCFFKKIFSKIIYKLPPKLVSFLFIRGRYDIEVAYLEGFTTKVIASRRNSAKKVAFVHCDVSVKPILQKYYKDKEFCLSEYRLFDKVAFVSEAAKKGFEETFGLLENFTVVHNVIDIEVIRKKAKEQVNFDFNTKGLKVIAIGRLSYEKAFERLIRIASKFQNQYDFEICIVGEGNLRSDLERLIDQLGVRSVRLLGYKDNPYPYMSKADVLVCSSLFEGYSTSVIEATILGVPVLTTDCAGMNEILKNNINGIIVDNVETALETKIKELICNNDLYDTIKIGAQENSIKYSNDYAVKEYDDLFTCCLKQSND